MAQPPEPTTTHVPALNKPYTSDMLPAGFVFKPKARCLLDHYLVPKALHGRVPDDVIQDAIADGIDVYAVRPEALPFPPRNCGTYDGHFEAWGYFFGTRPAAAAAGGGDGDVRDVSAGGCWCRYGREKEYADDDGEVYGFQTRHAFYEARDGGERTPWRVKEFRLNEGAACFRGVTFHPSAKDLVVWKVYNVVELPEEEPAEDYYSSDEDDEENEAKMNRFKVGDLCIAGPAANTA
ncbi:NAC transcription factor NAM-B1-like [Phragmites australis]|uniref:NAC transcription factor NAM-B1-like n=1 Tax=Phragmites australis TaxID=29695 RepID=UPI002D78B872|nr:NAC transcription factor NAM-B1-like [Phragmites australis]